MARVWDSEGNAFRAVSFYLWRGSRIARMEEYWGDVGPAPAWRREMGLGTLLPGDSPRLPAAVPMGRCGFFCGACPDRQAGTCPGCREAHSPGDCFIWDCTRRRGLDFCTLCGQFPCRELLERATALDRDCLRWKRRERNHLEESEDEGDNLPL